MADPFIQQLFLSPWSGAPARGQLPQVPQRPALPTAVAELAGCLVRIPGGSGAADATYECQKQAAGTYSWVQIDGGSGGPLGLLGYATGTTIDTITNGTTVDLTGLSIAVTVAASRVIRISITLSLQGTASTSSASVFIKEGSTTLVQRTWSPLATSRFQLADFIVLTPTAGSHTYKVSVQATGTGDTTSIAGAFTPAYILVEDVGAA